MTPRKRKGDDVEELDFDKSEPEPLPVDDFMRDDGLAWDSWLEKVEQERSWDE